MGALINIGLALLVGLLVYHCWRLTRFNRTLRFELDYRQKACDMYRREANRLRAVVGEKQLPPPIRERVSR